MRQKDSSDKAFLKFLIPMIVLLGIIYLVRSGYKAGQWFYDIIHQ